MSKNNVTILQVIKVLDIGGAERFCVDLSIKLKQLGYKVILCAFFQMHTELEETWSKNIQDHGIQVFHAAEWKGNDQFKYYLQGIRAISSFTDQNPIQVIHSHFQLGTIAAIYLKLKHRQLIVMRTAHNVNEWDANLYGWVRKQLFSKWIYPFALNAQVGVSQAIVDQLSQHLGTKLSKKKPKLIYNGINFPTLPSKNSDSSTHENNLVVGSVGRLAEQKGYIHLIRAIPKVLAKIPDVTFILLGAGPLHDVLLCEAASLDVLDHLILKGQVLDVYAHLKNFDLFISSSLWEGLPTAILEANWAEVPVIASKIPGNDEIVKDKETGWLVKPADPIALADSIIMALQSPDLRMKYSQKAKARIYQFSMDEISVQYANLYQELLGSYNDA